VRRAVKIAGVLVAFVLPGCTSLNQPGQSTGLGGSAARKPIVGTVASFGTSTETPRLMPLDPGSPGRSTSGLRGEPELAYAPSSDRHPTGFIPPDSEDVETPLRAANITAREAAPEDIDASAVPFRAGLFPDAVGVGQGQGSERGLAAGFVTLSPRSIRAPIQGNTCACPYDLDAAGITCGLNSDWASPNWFYPACYADPWGVTTSPAHLVLNSIKSST
jgi:hypothetical protein